MASEAGQGVAETTHYAALKELLNEAGDELTPKVRVLIHPRGSGVGIPDGEFWTVSLMPKPGQEALDLFSAKERIADHGALEAKGLDADLDKLKETEQVRRYLGRYRQVLLTNLREFAVVQMRDGSPTVIERYALAETPTAFLGLAEGDLKPHERPLKEFLRRALRAQTAIDTPGELAFFLASHARDAKAKLDLLEDFMELQSLKETMEGALGIRFAAGQGDAFFRAQLVETLFYGLFSAWVLWHEEEPARKDAFTYTQTAMYLSVPVIDRLYNAATTRRILERTGLRHALRNAADVLNRVERPNFFRTFADGSAVQYFYEPFLAQFDADLRKQLGVWYTPPEIVEGMVAQCDRLLMDELGEPDGLAGENVLVLDPCCGTGAFLVESLRVAAKRWEGRGEPYADRLRRAATSRMFGFELLTGPFVVAHLQVAFLLAKHGVRLEGDERAAVFLTNALTGWEPISPEKRALDPLALYAESDRAHEVKREERILVVVGNPPYSGYAGIAQMDEERGITDRYRPERSRGQGLNDLYVRFFAMADRRIQTTGKGLVCFVSNYSWLEGLSFAKMRRTLLENYDRVWIDNLHGDKYATGKTTPTGEPDPSAFSTETNREGIQVGTAVATLLRKDSRTPHPQPLSPGGERGAASVRYRDFWGVRKRAEFRAGVGEYVELAPSEALGYPFRPRAVEAVYLSWPRLPELFGKSFSGMKTARDSFLVDIEKPILSKRIAAYYDPKVSDEAMKHLSPASMVDTRGYEARTTRKRLQSKGVNEEGFVRYAYRPFDNRWLYWVGETKLLDEKRTDYVGHVGPINPVMVCAEAQRREFSPPLLTSEIASYHLIERASLIFPMQLAPKASTQVAQGSLVDFFEAAGTGSGFNLSELAWETLRRHGLADAPETVFYHALATMHAPAYAEENAGALRQDWPRVPLGLPSEGGSGGIGSSPLGEGREGVEDKAVPRESLEIVSQVEGREGVQSVSRAADANEDGTGLEGSRPHPYPSPEGGSGMIERSSSSEDPTREWLLRGAALGRRVAALLDIETPVRGIETGDLDPALRRVAKYEMGDDSSPRERTEDVALRARWGYRGQGGVVMPGPDSSVPDPTPTPPQGEGGPSGTRYVPANAKAGWTGVPDAVWNYHLGGYQVLKKWLSYREEAVLGRPLTLEEVRTFTAICRRIAALLALGPELDAHYRAAVGAAAKERADV